MITKGLSDVDGISRNQVVFSEKKNCAIVHLLGSIMADCRKYGKYFFEKMSQQHIRFNFLNSKVSDLAKIYETNLSLTGKTKEG